MVSEWKIVLALETLDLQANNLTLGTSTCSVHSQALSPVSPSPEEYHPTGWE